MPMPKLVPPKRNVTDLSSKTALKRLRPSVLCPSFLRGQSSAPPGLEEEREEAPLPSILPSPPLLSTCPPAPSSSASSLPASSSSAPAPSSTPPPPPSLPSSLQRLGNARAWRRVLDHLLSRRHVPIVVWGPTGCGKSVGARVLLQACGYRVLELDGAAAETTEEILLWVKRARHTKTLAGKTAVVLDDLESFPPPARKELSRLAAVDDPTFMPLLLTCTQFRDPAMRDVQRLTEVRLFPPGEQTCFEWFHKWHSWSVPGRGEEKREGEDEKRVGFPPGLLMQERDVLACGDLRRMHTSLVWRAASVVHKAPRLVEQQAPRAVRFANVFEASRSLLQRKASVEDWTSCAEFRDADLLSHHLPKAMRNQTGPDELDRLARGLDVFSGLDAGMPSRYECRDAHVPYVLDAAARTARVVATIEARSSGGLGALAPPPRLPFSYTAPLDIPSNLLPPKDVPTWSCALPQPKEWPPP